MAERWLWRDLPAEKRWSKDRYREQLRREDGTLPDYFEEYAQQHQDQIERAERGAGCQAAVSSYPHQVWLPCLKSPSAGRFCAVHARMFSQQDEPAAPLQRQPRRSVAELERENATLRHAFREIAWMARRYADGRMTYAASTYNDAVRAVLALGIELPVNADGTVWARDGMGRAFDRLTDEEAAQGRPMGYPLAGIDVDRRQGVIGALYARIGGGDGLCGICNMWVANGVPHAAGCALAALGNAAVQRQEEPAS